MIQSRTGLSSVLVSIPSAPAETLNLQVPVFPWTPYWQLMILLWLEMLQVPQCPLLWRLRLLQLQETENFIEGRKEKAYWGSRTISLWTQVLSSRLFQVQWNCSPQCERRGCARYRSCRYRRERVKDEELVDLATSILRKIYRSTVLCTTFLFKDFWISCELLESC